MHHLEVRQIPVDNSVLTDIGAYLETAPFETIQGSEVCTDQKILGLKCMHLTDALGTPRGTRVGATRLRGYMLKPLAISYPTDIIFVQGRGTATNDPLEIQDRSGAVVHRLVRGTSVRVTESILVVVPSGVTIDLVYISGPLADS